VRAEKQSRFKGLIVGTAAGMLPCVLFILGAFQAVEYQLYDFNFRQFQSSEPPAEIVVVAIDTHSLEKLGRWPWPRLYHAEIIKAISQNGAKVIGVDIGFFEPDRQVPENDLALAEATSMAGNIVYPVVIEIAGTGAERSAYRFETIPEIAKGSVGAGHVHIEPQSDGIVRKVYLSERLGTGSSWSWALEMLRVYLDLPEGAIRPDGEGYLRLGDIEIPVLEAPEQERKDAEYLQDYEMNIAFIGDEATFDQIPAYKVIEGDIPHGYFTDKIVVYGGTAQGLGDSFMTPFSDARALMPGVEIQANIVDTILKRRFIERAPLAMVCGLTLLVALTIGLIYELFETRVVVPILLLGIGGGLAAHFYLFNYHGLWLEITPIHSAMILSFVFGLLIKMRRVNVALDQEVLNLSRATELGDKAGEERVLEVFRCTESTFKQVLEIPAAALLRVDHAKGMMILTAQYGLTEPRNDKARRIKIHSALRELLIGLDPIPLDGLQKHPLAKIVGKTRSRLHHSLLVPMLAQGDTLGVLCLFRAKGSPFTSEEQELLQAMSSELGTTWYNAQLYERLVQITANPLAPLTYKSQERRIQTLSVLSESVLSEKSSMSAIMDSIADGVIVTDVLGTIRLTNPKAKDILGLYAEDAVGQNAADFIQRFFDVPYEDVRDHFEKVVKKGKVFSTEVKLSLPTTRFYNLSVGPVRSREGTVQGIVAVFSDITELKELDQMKTDLMSMVTHEIRTPLATVRGFAQILLKGGITAEKAKEFLEIINRQSNRLVNLVNDFLDITRIESGRQSVTKAPLDMRKLIENALVDLKPLADDKKITMHFDHPNVAVPEVRADRNLMEQVLINLLSNAIKYSPKGSEARVALRRDNGAVQVDIKDTGLGIPREALPRLFEKFYRVRCDDRKDIIGTGLGLSLVKQIIEVHAGTISVESEHGVGSTFTFSIPLQGSETEVADETFREIFDDGVSQPALRN
jgi:two-component system phosphate regulon sensor histidine kinase PhoR